MAYDIPIGAMTIYCEASDQSMAARLGVAWTFVNRMKLNPARFGKTISEVCLMRMQYSEWNADKADNANLRRAARAEDDDPILAECELLLREAMAGTAADPTGGATHYYDTSISAPDWTKGAVQCCHLGNMIFFKGVQ